MPDIIVTGSVAFDNIMDFPGYFKDHILPEKVHILSVSFLVETLKRQRGGAGANVAYNLALLGERPRLIAAVGADFGEYRDWMGSVGIDTSGVWEVEDEFTASAFITTDRDDNQITGFYPGAMRRAGELTLHETGRPDLVVITPDAPDAMARFSGECREIGIPWVYSPGQQIVSLSEEQLTNGVTGARCVIGNDYEMELIASKTGHRNDDLLELAEIVITTLGEHGSRIATRDGSWEIPALQPYGVKDPTGAGDAYVAGIARGIARGDAPEAYGRVAALAASHAISEYGTQVHSYEPSEFSARCIEHFGEDVLSGS
jgi:adenosine kinase